MIGFIHIVVIVRFQYVWKEERLQYKKHNHQLHNGNDPKRFTGTAHAGESFPKHGKPIESFCGFVII